MDLETLQELLRTGRDTPVTLTLRHEVPDGSFEITGGYTWSMTPAVWFFDPDGVRVHRHAGGYAVDRGTEPVARRAGRAVWLFHTTPPTYYDTAQVLTRPEVLPFLEPRLDAAVPAAVPQGSVAGRATWRVTLDDLLVDLDRETGVVLAVQAQGRRLSAVKVSFPEVGEDTAWHGPDQPFEVPVPPTPDPAEVEFPGLIAEPPSVAEGCVRVAATDMFLEGATPTYRPGDYLEHTLSLVTDPEAPALRCFIEPGTARPSGDETYWPSLAIGDGWFADVWPDAPCSGWQDIPGTLHLTGWAEQERPVAMVVERVFAKIVHADTWFRTSDSPVLWQEIGPETDYADQDGWQAVGALLDVRPVAGGPDGDHR